VTRISQRTGKSTSEATSGSRFGDIWNAVRSITIETAAFGLAPPARPMLRRRRGEANLAARLQSGPQATGWNAESAG